MFSSTPWISTLQQEGKPSAKKSNKAMEKFPTSFAFFSTLIITLDFLFLTFEIFLVCLGVFIPAVCVCVCAGFPYQVSLVRRHSVSRVN